MRAVPPEGGENAVPPSRRRATQQRCPYLEQIIKEPTAFGLLTRYKADCHVDHRTHRFTGRHPAPPCISQPATCQLYRDQWAEESHLIDRYRD